MNRIVPHEFGSFGAALAVSGLQFLSVILPSASAQANPTNFFDWENLESDISGVADRTDGNLVNPWGLALNPAGVFWVADNGTGVSTLYRPDGTILSLVVTIPPTAADTTPPIHAAPTGTVFNPFNDAFILKENNLPAAFIFDGEDGSITAWNGKLMPITQAVNRVDNSPSGAVYKGLALAVRKSAGPTLYAANFNSGNVDMFDKNFKPVIDPTAFKDPNLPKGYAPFGIASIDGKIYVTYALQDAEKHDDVKGAHHGFVDVYDTDGHNLQRLISQGLLDSPWGLAKVPDHRHFGRFDDDVLLVGNFGDGRINAYNVHTGAPLGPLNHRDGQPLEFNGLWSLFFFHDNLYFTAGIVDEADGLFGFIHRAKGKDSDD
jgi:uncharacterized protein (TIGR03118 family)